jgi:hypothetical protein
LIQLADACDIQALQRRISPLRPSS